MTEQNRILSVVGILEKETTTRNIAAAANSHKQKALSLDFVLVIKAVGDVEKKECPDGDMIADVAAPIR